MEDFDKMEGLEDLSIADQISEMHRVLRDEKEDRDYERWLYSDGSISSQMRGNTYSPGTTKK